LLIAASPAARLFGLDTLFANAKGR
jgi:hypothetical protein